MARSAPMPVRDTVTDRGGKVSRPWFDWLRTLSGRADAAPQQVRRVALAAQTATVGATALQGPTLAVGLYRATFYARVVTAATTSSSLTVTMGFTDGGIACTFSSAALTSNLTSSVLTGTVMLRADQASSVTYATMYASSGATAMLYDLSVTLEKMADA